MRTKTKVVGHRSHPARGPAFPAPRPFRRGKGGARRRGAGRPARFVREAAGRDRPLRAGRSARGPAVALVHGFSVPYYVWDPTAPELARAGFRVLRYDLYGRGYSDRPTPPTTRTSS